MNQFITDLNNVRSGQSPLNPNSSPSPRNSDNFVSGESETPALLMWWNTLIEYKDGQVRIIKSYSTVAKDSVVKKAQKPKKKEKVVRKATETKLEEEEVY